MAYKMEETTDKTRMTTPRPMGPGVTAALAEQAARMEVWASNFTDPGPDWCEFRLKDAEGAIIQLVRIEGY